jgi:hypothetical protein
VLCGSTHEKPEVSFLFCPAWAGTLWVAARGLPNTKQGNPRVPLCRLFTDIEFLDKLAVLFDILVFQIVKQAAAFPYQFDQGALCVEIFLVVFQVFGQVVDPMGKEGDLSLG